MAVTQVFEECSHQLLCVLCMHALVWFTVNRLEHRRIKYVFEVFSVTDLLAVAKTKVPFPGSLIAKVDGGQRITDY